MIKNSTKNVIGALAISLLVAVNALAWTPFVLEAKAQTTVPGQFIVPLGNCQLSATQLASSIGLASCVRASFTASAGTDATTMVVTSVAGIILPGDVIVSGTGLTVGTQITGQISGTTGGAGTYQLSASNTASSASTTSGGIPPQATMVYLQAETADVRYRDDGGAPTAAIGNILVHGAGGQQLYTGTLAKLRFILLSGSPLVNAGFYR